MRVWFNHWFSSAYHIIDMLKMANPNIKIIGTNKQINSVIKDVCDEWYEEPDINETEYITYCLNFCHEHDIDVFIPRRHLTLISRYKSLFISNDIKVMVDDYSVIKPLNDKSITYDMFKDDIEVQVPDYFVVYDYAEFIDAWTTLRKSYTDICMKFVKDEGAMSFRKIIDKPLDFNSLYQYQGANIEFDKLCNLLASKEKFTNGIMLMPVLSGSEISVDCLKVDNNLIAIPRCKSKSRHEYVEYTPDIMNMVNKISNKLSLKCPYNIQFRCDKNNVPYLLEINTRMSGGTYLSCLAADINIPDIAFKQLIGYKGIDVFYNKTEHIVSHVENGILIK